MPMPVVATMIPDEFLACERTQPERHQYVQGEVYAMAGGSPRHNRLAAKAIVALTHGLGGSSCGVYSSDQKLALAGEQFVYADAVVLCPPLLLRPGTTDVVMNPSVIGV